MGVDYFRTIGIPLLRGRQIAEEDINAPLINIFDEERVCEQLLRTDPKRAREVCQ